jgi:transcriptional regulator with XRE-family HTH domain
MDIMNSREFKEARLKRNWTQEDAARRLGMTQAYLNLLENGKRRLTPRLVRLAVSVYGLSPVALPVEEDFVPNRTTDDELMAWLAKLEYPGFAYLKTHATKKNPYELLLAALGQAKLDARVAEALPWVALKYGQPSLWLVETARKFNLQNKLGFVVAVARQLAENRDESTTARELAHLEEMLEESRLAKEGYFYRPPETETEREWLRQNRSSAAGHWNLLTDMRPEQLSYAR